MRDPVRAYYRAKTRALLAKYGPGPRVHFHVGFAEAADADADDAEELRRRLVASQESVLEEGCRMLEEASAALGGRVLDVGCGLGGGALFLAAHHGARVVALTPVAEHARLAGHFARQAGLEARVQPVVADAHAPPADATFDLAVAIESACYLDRPAWLRALRGVLRPGAHVLVVDGFLGDAAVKGEFDAYWHTDVAPLDHHLDAARDQGFVLEKQERWNGRAVGFWALSRAWTRRRMREPGAERARLSRSLSAHARFQRMYASGAIDYRALLLRREDGPGSGA